MVRLAKFIAQAGYCSRRRAEELIKSGEVSVNNSPAEVTTPFDPENDSLFIEGKPLNSEKKVYIILNKPPGYLSTCKPGREEGKTILDIVKIPERIYPVGRLDKNSRGLLILTNDGELANKVMHPSHEIEKEYLVKLDLRLTANDIVRLKGGIEIDGKVCYFHSVNIKFDTTYSIVLKQGMKRQIKMMIAALDKKVIDLQRIREGDLKLTHLPEGRWRFLNDEELLILKGVNSDEKN